MLPSIKHTSEIAPPTPSEQFYETVIVDSVYFSIPECVLWKYKVHYSIQCVLWKYKLYFPIPVCTLKV